MTSNFLTLNINTMTESQLQLGNEITYDKNEVYLQMKTMKESIGQVNRRSFKKENCKEDFDTFKQNLLNLCDKWVEEQREKMELRFSKI